MVANVDSAEELARDESEGDCAQQVPERDEDEVFDHFSPLRLKRILSGLPSKP